MYLNNLLAALLIPLGLFCLFRPSALIYLFAGISIVCFSPLIGQDSEFIIMKLGAVNIYAYDYLVFILLMILIFFFMKDAITKENIIYDVIKSPLTKLLIVMFMWSLVIAAFSLYKGFTVKNVLRNLSTESFIFIAILIPLLKPTPAAKRTFFRYAMLLGIILFFIGFIKYTMTQDIEMTSSGTPRTLLGNTVPIFMLPICYLLFSNDNWRKNNIISVIAILALSIGITFTGHRSGMMVLFMVLAIYYFSNDHNKVDYLWIPTLGIAGLLLFFLLINFSLRIPGESFITDVLTRAGDIVSFDNETTVERLAKWSFSLKILGTNPLIGLSRFPVYSGFLSGAQDNLSHFSALNLPPHNIFISKLIHEGIAGLLIISIFFFMIFFWIKKLFVMDKQYYKFLSIYFLCFIFFSMLNTSYSDPHSRVFFFIMLGFLNSGIVSSIKAVEIFQGNEGQLPIGVGI